MAQGRTRAAMVQAQRMKSGPKRAKKRLKERKIASVKKNYDEYRKNAPVTSTNTSYNATEKRYMKKDPLGQGG